MLISLVAAVLSVGLGTALGLGLGLGAAYFRGLIR